MKRYKIYQYIFPDGKIYIGTTKNDISTRKNQGYQHNKPLQNAIRNAKWENIKVVILKDGLSQEEAFEEEKKFIQKNNAIENGYNVSQGGKATYKGLKHSDEYKQHMSELYKGKVFSEQTLERMRESHKKERKSVACFTLDGKLINNFESLNEAARVIKGYPTNISRACKKEIKTYKGYIWNFI